MSRNENIVVLQVLRMFLLGMFLDSLLLLKIFKNKRRRRNEDGSYSLIDRIPDQVMHLMELTTLSHTTALHQLRLGRDSFGKLCVLLKQLGGLNDTRGVIVPEQVAMFLSVISHHKKNRVVFYDFKRSARTVSIHFHRVLQAVLNLHDTLIAKPVPVPNDSTDERWKWFKGCLGALNGTHVLVTVPDRDKGRYRSRHGKPSVNVLGVCDRKMNFTRSLLRIQLPSTQFLIQLMNFHQMGMQVEHLQQRFCFEEERYKTWSAIIEHEGVQFDELLMNVEASPLTWEAICKVHKLGETYRVTRTEPMWPELCGIFGPDSVRIQRKTAYTDLKKEVSPEYDQEEKKRVTKKRKMYSSDEAELEHPADPGTKNKNHKGTFKGSSSIKTGKQSKIAAKHFLDF